MVCYALIFKEKYLPLFIARLVAGICLPGQHESFFNGNRYPFCPLSHPTGHWGECSQGRKSQSGAITPGRIIGRAQASILARSLPELLLPGRIPGRNQR